MEPRSSWEDTDLNEEEKTSMRPVEVLERNVAGAISLVPFPVSDMGQTLCDVGDDGGPNPDSLGVNSCQRQ